MSDIIIDMDDSEFTERYNVLYFRNLASKYNISISEIINRIEAVSLKIKEFKIENPKLVI